MAERSMAHLWTMRGIYVGLCGLVIFLHLLPLDPVARSWATPDLMLALTFAWILRRPEFTPLILIAAIFLLADFLFQRPPGLWAALALIASQTLRARAPDLRDLTFPMEWLSVGVTLVAMIVTYRLVLAILVVEIPPLGLTVMQMLSTLIAYPFVVLVTQTVFRVRKIAPGEVNAMRSI